MRTDPKLTTGINKYWIKFFLTAVFATMWIRDHQRPVFHEALGVDPEWYGQEVFRKTSEISRQIFPLVLDIDHPSWLKGLKRLQQANEKLVEAKKRKGLVGRLGQLAASMQVGMAFVRLLVIPSISNEQPDTSRLQPAY